jgi:hypothetical protein
MDWRWVDTEHGRRLRDADNHDSDVIVLTGDGGLLVEPEHEALIAAAPKLLTALRGLMAYIDQYDHDASDPEKNRIGQEAWANAVIAANEATGPELPP